MGWRELSQQSEISSNILNMLRGWFLVLLVSALGGWGVMDVALAVGQSGHI